MRNYLCKENEGSDVFEWSIRMMLYCGVHKSRMTTFLEEQGITKEEIETSSSRHKDGKRKEKLVSFVACVTFRRA